MSARNKLNRQDYGGNLNLNLFENQLQIGLTYLGTIYSVPVLKRPTTYNQYDFAGLANYNYSINYSFIRQNYNLFGEIARSKSNGTGIVSGLIASLSAKTDLAVVYRKYERDFHSFYGNAFGENIKNSNEEGLYIGLRITPIKKIILNGYFDRYRKPWLSYQCNAPSNGYEYLAKLQYNPNKSSSLYCQLRSETREKNRKNIETPLASIEDERTTKWILGINFQPLKKVLLKSRVQGSVVQQGSYYSRGMALLQEATLEVKPFKISGRYCLFDTDDYASRQYIYEKDVLYSFSFPVLYGEGSRNFILLEYKYSRSLDLWIKASQTTYNDRDSIGSGTESIKGNKKTDIRIQLKYNF
jgi:hypothetical protein